MRLPTAFIVLLVSIALVASLLVFPSMVGAKPHDHPGPPHPPPSQTPTTFSGRATGVVVSTPFVTLRFADTGELPPEGGTIDATPVKVREELVHADVLLSVTMGFDKFAQSEAALADVTVLPGTPTEVVADFVRARSQATCDGISGESEIVRLFVAGEEIIVTGKPNQVVTVPGILVLIINEQRDTSSEETNEITVNALHLFLIPTGSEVIASSARSDITCHKKQPVERDFVTGGGFILVDGGKATFGFVAGFKPNQDSLSGQFTYQDHTTGMKVKATGITEWIVVSGNTRTFGGSATIDGQPGTFSVTVTDTGEPGRNADEFEISLSSGYSASGILAGGNIQLHSR